MNTKCVPLDEARMLHALCVHDLIARKFPPRVELLGPWLRSQDLSMIHAQRGVGKTFLALSVGLAVASGSGLLTWQAPKPRKVLYIDGEMPGVTLQERCRGFMAANDWKPDPGFFRIVTPDTQERPIPDLSDASGQKIAEGVIDSAELVIVDNLSTLCRTGIENDADSWGAMQEWALSLRKRGTSVLFVHHSGKSGAQRGTSRREDVLDAVINLRRPSDYHAEEGARFEVHFEKARGLFGDAVKPIEAKLHSGDDDTAIWTHRSVEDSSKESIIELLRGGMSQREVAREIGVSKSWVNKVAMQARADGEL